MSDEKQKLPLIPGFTIYRPKEHYHLPQRWLCIDGLNLLCEKKQADNNWILNDGKILCFNAYFLQGVEGISVQIRKVKILFYLEDGTIQVVEKRTENSGMPQGCIVKRQKVPRSRDQVEDLSILDLNVQKNVDIFDRIYVITDCDAFTRSYLTKAGIEVPEPIETPKDPRHVSREDMIQAKELQAARKSQSDERKPKKGSELHNLCLKFDAYWDDRDSQSGDLHNLIVYYYLADDTIQINETFKQGKPKILCRRLKLPKKTDDVLNIEQEKNSVVLNVIGCDFMNSRCIADRLHIGKPNIDCYSDKDLKIGATLNVFGRAIVIVDCDKFTREYYKTKYGIEEFVPIEKPVDHRCAPLCVEVVMPPYNGFGSFEDSEASCNSIQPKPPQRDMKKFLQLDKCNLRFRAMMISDIAEDSDREFVITYYLSDDTISVFEIGKSNGYPSGDFLRRGKYYLPKQNIFQSSRPEQYTPQRFYIGATINLNGFNFHLTDADEFTLNFMETHHFEYPKADISSILSKIKEAIQPIYRDFVSSFLGVANITDTESNSNAICVCSDTTTLALRDLLGNRITEHEIVTFLRYFSADKSLNKLKPRDRTTVQSLVQMTLSNKLWDEIKSLKEFIYDFDPKNHNGFISPSKLRTVIKRCRLPLNEVLINDMFLVLNKDADGNIDVNDFLYFIDDKKSKAPPIQPINLYSDDDKKAFNSGSHPSLIDWSAFIAELGLETNLKQETE